MNVLGTPLVSGTVRELVRRLDPTLSVYLGLESGEPPVVAERDAQLRWRALAATARRLGADQATADAVGEYLEAQPYQATELALFAADGAVRQVQPIPGGARFDRVRYGAPADVAPLLAWLARHPAYVLVVTDRTGADITQVRAGSATGETVVVEGPDDEIERNAPGGWSQPRYQRRAEDSWQHNASAVATAAVHALRRTGARLLLVAGDVRAVQLLRDHMPLGLRRDITVQHLPGGRSPDGSAGLRAAALQEAIREYVATESARAVMHFIDARGPSGMALEGVAATLPALAAGRLSSLLVADDPDDERLAWFGPDLPAAADAAVPPFGAERQGRLVDVAIRAAVLTDADVHVLGREDAAEIAEGIGGLTRF
jgi:hypothetical protein